MMKLLSLHTQGWLCFTASAEETQAVVWLLCADMTPERLNALHAALDPHVPALALAGFGPVEWDYDYAPWVADTPDGRHFGSGADALISRALTELMPAVQQHTGRTLPVYAVGYSLGGLAALYAGCSTQAFAGIGSCSGSLWYPHFLPWMKAHPPVCPVYLSLGGKEKHARDPLMAQVESKTQEAFDLLRPICQTAFVHEPGGHFSAPEKRLAHAINWLLTPHR